MYLHGRIVDSLRPCFSFALATSHRNDIRRDYFPDFIRSAVGRLRGFTRKLRKKREKQILRKNRAAWFPNLTSKSIFLVKKKRRKKFVLLILLNFVHKLANTIIFTIVAFYVVQANYHITPAVPRMREHIEIYIRWHFAVRFATRPIQSRPNRKMSRNVGNWKAYSYFFDTHTHAISRIAVVYFHFACLTRGVHNPPPTKKGGECREGAHSLPTESGMRRERTRTAERCVGKCKRGEWCRSMRKRKRERERVLPFMRFISGKQPPRAYYTNARIFHNRLFQFFQTRLETRSKRWMSRDYPRMATYYRDIVFFFLLWRMKSW